LGIGWNGNYIATVRPVLLAVEKEKFKGVTPSTLFRGFTGEDLIGPYVSQFLLKPFNYGPYALSGTMRMYVPGIDYMTDQASWLAVQNGQGPSAPNVPGPVRYTFTGRDFDRLRP
jgi:hypothetical protein